MQGHHILFFLLLCLSSLAQENYRDFEDRKRAQIEELKKLYDEVQPYDIFQEPLSDMISRVRKKDVWGICIGLSEMIPPQYENIFKVYTRGESKHQYLFTTQKKGKHGLADINFKRGQYVYSESIPPIFDQICIGGMHAGYTDSREQYLFVNALSKNKWGVCIHHLSGKHNEDPTIAPVLGFKYDDIKNNLHYGYAIIKMENKWGLINIKGEELLKPIYDSITETNAVCTEMVGFKLGDKWGIYDVKNYKTLAEPKYESYYCYDLNNVNINLKGSSGIFSRLSMKDVFSKQDIETDANILIEKKDGKLIIYDNKGEKISKNTYDKKAHFNNRYILVSSGGKMGMVDKKLAKELVPPRYDTIENYYQISRVVFWVRNNGKWGFIDTSGKEVVSPSYDNRIFGCLFDEKGRNNTIVTKGTMWGMIDENGNLIAPLKYDGIYNTGSYNPILTIKFGKKYGIMDLVTGKEIISPVYDEVKFGVLKKNQNGFPYPIDYYTAKQDGKTIYLSPAGGIIRQPEE